MIVIANSYQSPFFEIQPRLFENEVGFVVFDGFPVSEGHCLIVPHRVYADYFDSTPEEFTGLNDLLTQSQNFLKAEYRPTGFNVGINCGKDSGQTIFHVHIHLIPRYLGDVPDARGGVRGVIPSKQKY
jgi:diadenosine tetraphosphate (Ap4A) HIT family hydrolase